MFMLIKSVHRFTLHNSTTRRAFDLPLLAASEAPKAYHPQLPIHQNLYLVLMIWHA
jgi:hypothetical protein